MAVNISIPWENLQRRYSRYYVYIEPIVSDPLIRGYFSLVASILLVTFFLVFALSPTINTILALTKKIGEERDSIKILDQKIANLVVAQENYARVENSLPVLLTAVPVNPTPQTIISGIDSSASASAVVLSGLSFRDLPLSPVTQAATVGQETGPDVPTASFSLAVSGSLDQVHGFLKRMENLPRLIHITDLSITKATGAAAGSANISAVGYYLAE